MTHVLADVVARDSEHDGVLLALQQVHQCAQQLLPALVEARRVLTPELSRLVHRRPFQTTNVLKSMSASIFSNNERLDGWGVCINIDVLSA